MIFWPAVLPPTPPQLLPTSRAARPQVSHAVGALPQTPIDTCSFEAHGLAAEAAPAGGGKGWAEHVPLGAQTLRRALVHGSMQVAALTLPAAVWRDLAAPVGPSVINPMGQIHPDAPLYALFCLLVSNGITAPLMARSTWRLVAQSSTRHLAQAGERRSAALYGTLGAAVAVVAAMLACVRLRDEIACRGAATGWEHGAFPNMYYWHALSFSAQALVPVSALLGYHTASHLRACELLGAERTDGLGPLEMSPQPG